MAETIRRKLSMEQIRKEANELVQKNRNLMEKWREQSTDDARTLRTQHRDIEAGRFEAARSAKTKMS
jgi:hypothetical protein